MKDEKLLNKWLLGELSPEEGEQFQQSPEYPGIIKIWETLPEVATPPTFDASQELERFKSKHQTKKNTKVIQLSWNQRLIGIAASLILVSALSFLLVQKSFLSNEPITLTETQVPLYLPDSSTIVLNKGSKLKYTKEDWADQRSVSLEGEAFFQVKKGSTFDVVTADGTVSVLGTSFNVKQRNQIYEIVCYEGKVGVKTANHQIALTAGKGFLLIKNDAAEFDINISDKPDWMDGKSSFYKTPYFAVLAEVENQYDLIIETKAVNLQNTFTGSFPNDNLKIALDAITTPSGYHYEVNDNKVLISHGNN